MYPIISENYFIKGCLDNFFLLSNKTFQEFPINNLQAEIISNCNGYFSIIELQKKFQKKGVNQKTLKTFLNSIKKSGFVEFLLEKKARIEQSNISLLKVKKPYLKEVHLDLTKKCNLRCLYCYQEPYIGENLIGQELSLKEIKSLIDNLAEMNIAKLVISGGEPFLMPFLPEVIDYANSKKIIVPTIFTNGTVFGKNFEHIKNYPNKINLALSLDGQNEEVHGYSRGKQSFKEVINFIELIGNNNIHKNIQLIIDTIITPVNYQYLKEMYLFLGNLKVVSRWRVSVPREQGSFLNNEKKLQIDIDSVLLEYKQFIEWYIKEGNLIFPNMSIQIESIFRSSILKGEKICTFSKEKNCCEYKANALAIKPNGDVTICTAFTDLVIDNIRENPIQLIWKSKKMQNLKQLKISKIKDCLNCEELYLCGTGCRKVASDKNGILRKDETACKIYKFFNHEIIPQFYSLGLNPFNL